MSKTEYEIEVQFSDGLSLKAREQLQYVAFSWFEGDKRLSVGWMTQNQIRSFIGALVDLRAQGRGVFEMPGWGEHETSRLVFENEGDKVKMVGNYPVQVIAKTSSAELNGFEEYLEGKIGLKSP